LYMDAALSLDGFMAEHVRAAVQGRGLDTVRLSILLGFVEQAMTRKKGASLPSVDELKVNASCHLAWLISLQHTESNSDVQCEKQ
jgi:hypothetical protein